MPDMRERRRGNKPNSAARKDVIANVGPPSLAINLINLYPASAWITRHIVYDEEHDLFRFPDGEFAFSEEYINERRLREQGIIG